ncbi:response regulator [candidate division CSSED10-310 bacterium]|uniref:Response regulator n=1 Tax=candidate division CSSED10-310 bacterium TaxID=2855610 RepID=A0ABV6Z412_UNCC1
MKEIPKILIVDDDMIVAINIKSTLESWGYSITFIARSGKEALQKVTEFSPDLVLMDINLRGNLTGIETAEELRSLYYLPVIYLTACEDEDTMSSADGYLLKPLNKSELKKSIKAALQKYSPGSQSRSSISFRSEYLDSPLPFY